MLPLPTARSGPERGERGSCSPACQPAWGNDSEAKIRGREGGEGSCPPLHVSGTGRDTAAKASDLEPYTEWGIRVAPDSPRVTGGNG